MASSVVLMLVGAGRFLQRRVDDELAALGLTLRHLSALGHLSHRPDLSYSDLARRARITTQSMHATVRSLEERGAVQRVLAGHGHGRDRALAVGVVALLADEQAPQVEDLALESRQAHRPDAQGEAAGEAGAHRDPHPSRHGLRG